MEQNTKMNYSGNNPLKRRCTASQHPDAAARYCKSAPAPGWMLQSGAISPTSSTAPTSPSASEAATTDTEMEDVEMGGASKSHEKAGSHRGDVQENVGVYREDIHEEVGVYRGDMARKRFNAAAVVPELLVRHRVFKGGKPIAEEATAC
ncbi:uncharacterized protein H6S33_011209 [Morchella sextelata]|uniref:uncharacterized protein n=1 Tax=Morchella sextelata TaxID=1174677 RepID=UPI001D04C23D|nr:uncharacterized protein H6S33_011209 [Morchella sextelata]KAH0610782.1 hypothetical protein H6S33_011209 [Morchella sextelata]